ncbi:hypothetical protein BC832DRAFT_354441 [Gaertneriomyces semiglobifer]|nr:hypothetical protein BC832DRAFT_354441 [Gaertneriomyces semiglobifer]
MTFTTTERMDLDFDVGDLTAATTTATTASTADDGHHYHHHHNHHHMDLTSLDLDIHRLLGGESDALLLSNEAEDAHDASFEAIPSVVVPSNNPIVVPSNTSPQDASSHMTLAGSNVLESHHDGVLYSQQHLQLPPQGNNYSYMENQQLNAFVLAQAQQQQQQFDAHHHLPSPYTTTTAVQPSPFITLQSPYSHTQAYPNQQHHDSTAAFDMHSLLEGLKTPRENVVTPYSVLTTTPQIGLATPLTVLSTPHLGLVGLATPHTLLTTPLVAVDGTPHLGLVTPHTSVSTPQETHLLDELESELRQLGETGAATQGLPTPDGDERAVAKLMEAVRRVKARQLGNTVVQQKMQQQQHQQSQLHGGSVGLGGDTQWGLPQALPTPPANELLGCDQRFAVGAPSIR